MRQPLLALALLLSATPLPADTPRTHEEIEAFMQTAKVVARRETSVGVTRPLRLTMSDGITTHDALFQAVDERKTLYQPPRGESEVNFVDSWRYNVAAARLARLLGIGRMMPPTIEYQYNGKTGSLAWWMESLMSEGDRLKKKVRPPDPVKWNQDMY